MNSSYAFLLSILQNKYPGYDFYINNEILFFKKRNGPYSYQCPINDINVITMDGEVINIII